MGEESVENPAGSSRRTAAADEFMVPVPPATAEDPAPGNALSAEGGEAANDALAPDDGEVPGDALIPVAGEEIALEAQGDFPDVSAEAWYAGVVNRAASLGLISGCSNGRFGPNDRITREQLAVMIANYASRRAGIAVRGSAVRYINMADATSVSSYVRTSMGWCFRNGVLSGTGSGYANPKGNASRAEAAKVTLRLYAIATTGEVRPSASDTWPYYELYSGVIERAMRGSGEFSESYRNADSGYWRESVEYSLYDFGGDGVPELFVRGGTAAAYMATHVATRHQTGR